MSIDDVTFDLIMEALRSLCGIDVLSVSRDPRRENGLIWITMSGEITGSVSRKGDNFAFLVGGQEVLVPASKILGKLQ